MDPKKDQVNVGLAILSFFIPLAGLIIFIKDRKDRPDHADICGICALIGFIVLLVIACIVVFMWMIYAAMEWSLYATEYFGNIFLEETR